MRGRRWRGSRAGLRERAGPSRGRYLRPGRGRDARASPSRTPPRPIRKLPSRSRGRSPRLAERCAPYEAELEEAREALRGLRREEEACVERLALEQRRLQDAGQRADAARERLAPAVFGAGVGEPFSLAEQARAQREIDQADGDARRAEAAIGRERDELARLRRAAVRKREGAEEAEATTAAATVRHAAGELPDVRLPGGQVSPPALAGTPFDPFSRSDFDRRLAAPAGADEEGAEPDGGRLKVPDPGESLADRLFGRDYIYPEEAAGTVLENGAGSGAAKALGRVLGIGAAKAAHPGSGSPPAAGSRHTRAPNAATPSTATSASPTTPCATG